MTVKLLTEHHLEFLSLKGGCTGSSESIHVKMPQCWKSHVAARMYIQTDIRIGAFARIHTHARSHALEKNIVFRSKKLDVRKVKDV